MRTASMFPPKKQAPQSRETIVRLGPWKGVRDLGDAGAQDPAYLQDAVNCWFRGDRRSIYVRPGMELLKATALESGARIHCVFGVEEAGNFYVFCIVNGKLYRQSSITTWTDVSPVGITISTTPIGLRVLAVPYNGEVIITDGVNEPWRLSAFASSPCTGTEIEIDTAGSAWVARGAPTVHGGKLFFIVESIASTTYEERFVWSEEGDAATGYLQDGFTDSWDLVQAQTISRRIYAIQGSNTALYVFRNNSIAIIYGAVSTDFVTASTHDGIDKVGISKDAKDVCLANGYVWFINNHHQPSRFRLGSTDVEPIWEQLQNRIHADRIGDSGSASAEAPQIVHIPDLDKIVALFGRADGSSFANLYVFNAQTGNYEGRWTLSSVIAANADLASVIGVAARSNNGTDMVAAGAVTLLVGCNDGFLWHQTAVQSYGSYTRSIGDFDRTDTSPITMSITTMLAPDEQNTEFRINGAAMEALPDSNTLTLTQYTPYGAATALNATGITNSDSIQTSHDHGIYRYGLNQLGRWWRGVWSWSVPADINSGNIPSAFERATIKVIPQKASAGAK